MTRLKWRSRHLQPSKVIRTRCALVLPVVSLCTACSLMTPSLPGQVDTAEHYERRAYAGVAGATTQLKPITDGSAYELEESASTGVAVTLGLDVATRLALELTAADLGAASLAPIATAGPGVAPQQLTYSTVAGSLLYYVLGDRVRVNQRRGLAGYARVGLSQTSTSADIDVDEQNALQMFAGLGAEFMMGRSTGLRAEVVGYDGDASAAQLGLVYRFGRSKVRRPGPIVENSPRSTDPKPTTPVIVTAEVDHQVDTGAENMDKLPLGVEPATATSEAGQAEVAQVGVEQAGVELNTPSDDLSLAGNTPTAELLEPAANVDAVIEHSQREQTADAQSDIIDAENSNIDPQIATVTPPVVALKLPANKDASPANNPGDQHAATNPDIALIKPPEVTAQPTVHKEVPPIKTPEVDTRVDEQQVAMVKKSTLEGILRGVDFTDGTDTLTESGTRLLIRYAEELKNSPDQRIEIRTHTDGSMDAASAMQLTRMRAVSIARLLIRAGVKKQRLAARAFGSNVPRADNLSVGGRRLNNRVEIKLL